MAHCTARPTLWHGGKYGKQLGDGEGPRARGGDKGTDGEGTCTALAKKDHSWRSAATRDALRKALTHLDRGTGPTTQVEGGSSSDKPE